jgi:SAM-dependent methyltransferase
MPSELLSALARVRAALLDEQRLVRAVASGRRSGGDARWRRAELRPVALKAGPRLQVTTFDAHQAFAANWPWSDAADQVDELLAQPFTSWQVELTDETLRLQVTRRGEAILSTARAARDRAELLAHDRAKPRLLDVHAPFLHHLGVTTPEGRVKSDRRDKFHQVEEFLRVLDPVIRDARDAGRLPAERATRVVDLGCGNAYLTFATYHYLTTTVGLDVEMVGVDQRDAARAHNVGVAEQLGWTQHMTFVAGNIAGAPVDGPVDVVVALHACDTATDDALARAVGWEAPVILAAPCCHHDLQRQIKTSRAVPRPYGVVAQHGILRERLADVLTDALRASILRQVGYRTDVIEFVDTAHTPRNAMLRAIRTGAPPGEESVADYRRLVADWQVRPRLAELLGFSPDPTS